MPRRAEVYSVLDGERDYQDWKGTETSGAPHTHSVEEYTLYMEDYMHELRNVLSRTWGPGAKEKALHVLRKVTALGVACMEEHGAPRREKAV